MRSWLQALLIATLCGGTGCSSDSGKGPVDTLYASLATELCKYVYSCCESSELGVFKNAFADQTSCERYLDVLLQGEHDTYRLAIARGGVTVPGAALDACLAALRGMTCGTFKLSPGATTPPFSGGTLGAIEACGVSRIYVGVRKAGEACETVLDCAAGLTCYSSGVLKNAGVCTPLRKQGDPCQSAKECETGLTCSHPTNAYTTCMPFAGEGQPCKEVGCDPAQTDLFCDSSKDPRSPTCTRRVRKKEGEACGSTATALCDKGLYCNYSTAPTAPVCARYSAGGEPCTTSSQCESARCDSVARICIGQLCDGKSNGPPPQLDQGVPDLRKDYRLDYRLDYRPVYPDWWRPDVKPVVDLRKQEGFVWPDRPTPDL